MNLFVVGLPRSIDNDGLRELLEEYGSVLSSKVVRDHNSGESRGFGFVRMSNQEEGQKAINELTGVSIDGNSLTIKEARERE